jgi:hypothetical protein
MGGVAWAIPATGGTWTAISQLPSLKASALWGQGDTWSGGGFFLSNDTFWLEADDKTFLIRDHSGLRREVDRPHLRFRSREERDGWGGKGGDPTAIEKSIRNGWILRKFGWAAQGDRKRLVWAEKGCLRSARIGSHKLGPVRTLYDFNGMVPSGLDGEGVSDIKPSRK